MDRSGYEKKTLSLLRSFRETREEKLETAGKDPEEPRDSANGPLMPHDFHKAGKTYVNKFR